MTILLIRHAESTWNASGRWQGQSDVPLSPRGQLQARALAARLFGLEVDARVCSDLSRAADTAAALGAPATPEPRLREIDVGAWAGRKRREVAEEFAEEVRALRAGEPVRIGGGESMPEFEARVDEALDDLLLRHEGERLLVVTHGGVIRAIATRVLDLRGRASPVDGVANTSVSELERVDGALRLVRYNDAQHLEPDDQESSISRLPEPTTHVALVVSEEGAESSRRLADGLLMALGIAQYYALGATSKEPLAEHLLVDPVDGPDPAAILERLRAEHEMGAFGLLAGPETVRHLTARAIGLSEEGERGLALPTHGTVAQIRVTKRGALLHSYGLAVQL